MKDYLIQRFLKNNHNKYSKYVNEWINNLTADQIAYFILEKQRIDGEDFIKNNNR
jgi:Zn-dependent membrane protease YugP